MNLRTCSCKQFAEEYANREGTSYMEDFFRHDAGQELLDILDTVRDIKKEHYANWTAIGLALHYAEQAFREGIIDDWEADDAFVDDDFVVDFFEDNDEAWDVETRGTIPHVPAIRWNGEPV